MYMYTWECLHRLGQGSDCLQIDTYRSGDLLTVCISSLTLQAFICILYRTQCILIVHISIHIYMYIHVGRAINYVDYIYIL